MSIADKITRLQAAKTAIGTAITAKGGTVAAGDGFEDFAADVGTIPAGGGATDLSTQRSAWAMFGDVDSNGRWNDTGRYDFQETVVLPNMPKCVYAARMFIGNRATKELTLGGFSTDGVNLSEAFREARALQKVTLERDIYPLNVHYWDSLFGGEYREDSGFFGPGRLNMSLCTTGSINGSYIRRIRFVENTIKINCFAGAFMYKGTDDSIISVANGLCESVTSTVMLAPQAKNRLTVIVGTVAMDETNTFHIFTADAGGTVTLADFITDTKGWTIA